MGAGDSKNRGKVVVDKINSDNAKSHIFSALVEGKISITKS